MPRPTEYENLVKTRAFEAVAPTPGAIAGFLRNAEDYKATADELDPTRHLQVFTLAYEGYFQLVQAVLEFYEVRTKDAGRNLAIQRVSTSLGVSPPRNSPSSRRPTSDATARRTFRRFRRCRKPRPPPCWASWRNTCLLHVR
ncbi:hypothetical protein [Burkholderia cenocepacia]|uniref:hypothetical protein n=1 Tax=Burkholderia cenocepacia TaxID=95486 RepID=UPI002AB7CDDC|nr:hypothetical protein [Burkholderia cenocepacia]